MSVIEGRIKMRRSRFTAQQVVAALLRQAEGGTPVQEVCRKLGISEQTFYRWKRKYAGIGGSNCGGFARWKTRSRRNE
jgi:putative transposase